MGQSTSLLNKVQSMLIAFASDRGINLADEFGTVEKFKEFVIAFTFKALVDAGASVEVAYNAVFGDAAYERIVTQVWESAQKSA